MLVGKDDFSFAVWTSAGGVNEPWVYAGFVEY